MKTSPSWSTEEIGSWRSGIQNKEVMQCKSNKINKLRNAINNLVEPLQLDIKHQVILMMTGYCPPGIEEKVDPRCQSCMKVKHKSLRIHETSRRHEGCNGERER